MNWPKAFRDVGVAAAFALALGAWLVSCEYFNSPNMWSVYEKENKFKSEINK